MDNQLLTEKLKSHIESQIAAGRYSPGGRLPPLRALAEQFGLTIGTARRAVKDLCDSGLLTFRHGSGTYVNTRMEREDTGKTIAVVLWNEEVAISYCAHAASGLIAAAEGSGYLLRFYYIPDGPGIEKVVFPVEIWEACAVVFLGTYDKFELDNFIGNKPCAGIEMHEQFKGVLSPISIDPFAAAEIAVNYFREKKIEQVTICTADTPLHQARAGVFRMLWENYGHCRCVTFVSDLPARLPAPNHGLFFTGGTDHNNFILKLKKKMKTDKPAYPNILSVDGKSLIIPHYEPANTIYIDWRKAGIAAFSECRRRIETPGAEARRIYLSPVFSRIGGL